MDINLKDSSADYITAMLRSAFGQVPLIGGFISEVITNIIPNQRIGRIAKYLELLASKLNSIDLDKLNGLLQNPEIIDLFEEGIFQASRALSDERKSYIASLVINGMTENEIEVSRAKFVFSILKEINDEQIILLQYYYRDSPSLKQAFKEKHSDIIKERYSFTHMTLKERVDYEVQNAYKSHLERLRLVKYNLKLNADNKPQFKKDGQGNIDSIELTPLGGYLLKLIGLVDDIYGNWKE